MAEIQGGKAGELIKASAVKYYKGTPIIRNGPMSSRIIFLDPHLWKKVSIKSNKKL